MVCECIVGDGDGSGSMDGIDQAIRTRGERVMVDPYVFTAKDADAIPIWTLSIPHMRRGAHHHALLARLAVMYVYAMHYHIVHILYGQAWPMGNVHIGPPAINGLVTGDHELVFEHYGHVMGKIDP